MFTSPTDVDVRSYTDLYKDPDKPIVQRITWMCYLGNPIIDLSVHVGYDVDTQEIVVRNSNGKIDRTDAKCAKNLEVAVAVIQALYVDKLEPARITLEWL